MNTYAHSGPAHAQMGWFARAESWLDDKGKGAWIAVMVLGFVIFWPVGLALLAYMIWSKKMTFTSTSHRNRSCGWHPKSHNTRSTGNSAFDAYKSETLRRLEEEQENFESFLQRLRESRDKAEFDQFMEDRAKAASSSGHDRDGEATNDAAKDST